MCFRLRLFTCKIMGYTFFPERVIDYLRGNRLVLLH